MSVHAARAATVQVEDPAPAGRPGRSARRYAIQAADGRLWVTHCAWCKRVQASDGEWDALPHVSRQEAGVSHTHGICAPCADAWRATYGRYLPTLPKRA